MEGPLMPMFSSPAPWSWAIGIPAVLALTAWALRVVRRSAVLAGIPLGVLVLRLGGLGAFFILLGFFLLGTALTRFGYATKAARGVAEGSGGRRGASHVVANCGVGLLLLAARGILLHAGVGERWDVLVWAAFVGSFATAASDTGSSEIGQLFGRHPVSLRNFRPVPIGTEGAVSTEGLLAGLCAAAVMALLGRAVGLLDWPGAAAVTAGGFLGNVLESLAGTWGRRVLPHGLLNFANTAVGAALAAIGVAIL
jgi:uncharacterized protein (TIGR00297 family)